MRRTARARRPRILWLDAARGVAIIAMVAYHASFDLLFFGYVDWPVTTGAGWRAFAASIASSFLFLVGVSLVISHPDGIRWRSFWRRFAVIAGAALLVTLGTAFAMPAPVYFGILHAIAAFSLLALPFLRAPVALTLLAALATFALPHFVRGDVFNAPWAYPLGLATVPPFTFDYEPIFPWFGATLVGVAFARLFRQTAQTGDPGPFWDGVMALGRNSLLIYLLHQPVLFAFFMLLDRL
nr:heparan-alpha-glucosaminide N-acetyltransferase [Acuticoccus kalidii]